jgi:ABC-type multidrug transport system permease subunit
MNSLYQLILVHFRTFIREPAILFWAILFPILMAWILGIAFSSSGEITRTVFVTGSTTPPSALTGVKTFGTDQGSPVKVRFENHPEGDAIRAIKRGIIGLYLEVRDDSVFYHYDPANAEARLTHLLIEREMNGVKNAPAKIKPLATIGTRYIDFLIPGLIALGIMNSCLWGISWNLIETRMKKLLRRMVATPMRKPIFLASHIITRVILGGVETLLLFTFSWWYFGTTITGSVSAFVLIFLSGVLAFSGIGILIASRTDKSEVGNGLINAATLSMMILSGIFFNYHNFPDWAVAFIQYLPLTILADGIRAVFIEAASLADVAGSIFILAATGIAGFAAGLRIFKWY